MPPFGDKRPRVAERAKEKRIKKAIALELEEILRAIAWRKTT
ncbi:MAG: hypothetical protein QNJ72_17120 [Pleurocapsa sp. MO_226.B13]|nr:hypothetical protein [Pleurocapsa sp. MO_226.B13]